MIGKLQAFVASLAGRAIMLALVAGLVLFAVNQCSEARQASTRAKLGEGQAENAAANTADAVGTIGSVADRASDGDTLTRSNANAIESAQGSGDAVHPAVTGAGLDSLCRRAAYRDSPQCVRRAAARGLAGAGAGGAAP